MSLRNNNVKLDCLVKMASWFKSMGEKEKGNREKDITTDTSHALSHTLNGIVDLCKHLLDTTHDFVLLGNYSTDPLEKAFGKLRQGSKGTYFLNVQQIVEKLNINKTKLLLKLNADVGILNVNIGH